MNSNRYVHPRPGVIARIVERIANSSNLISLRRKVVSQLPFPVLASDVTNVVYSTWLVDADRARRFAPADAVLWEQNGLTPFTILTYRHGHFGLEMTGPLRTLFPSPLQSNWRLYLASALPGALAVPTVAFVKNVVSSSFYALGTRIFSDALPTHFPQSFSFRVDADGAAVAIDPGAGSAPRLAARFERTHVRELPIALSSLANSWEAAVTRLASQDAAVVPVPDLARTAFATISLPLDLPSIVPLRLLPGTLDCPLLRELGAQEACFSFLLPSVHFRVLSERLLESSQSQQRAVREM